MPKTVNKTFRCPDCEAIVAAPVLESVERMWCPVCQLKWQGVSADSMRMRYANPDGYCNHCKLCTVSKCGNCAARCECGWHRFVLGEVDFLAPTQEEIDLATAGLRKALEEVERLG